MHDSIADKLARLEQKFAAQGQDLTVYLDGLLQADYLTYWDYIHLETLLSLQNPKTAFPDELIFVTYHQITELYFKLILHEIAQIADARPLTAAFFVARMQRVNRYVDLLEQSFGVVISGMDRDQFLKFRMALMPSSGFQSVQFREIEIVSTHFQNLLANVPNEPRTIADRYDGIYWKQGATELSTGQKSLTLIQFDQKYASRLVRLAEDYQTKNLHERFCTLEQAKQTTPELADVLREYDYRVNVRWKLAHLRSAVQHLHRGTPATQPETAKATGGTNWQTYLPPVQQQRVFFPALWSAEELQNWGQSGRQA